MPLTTEKAAPTMVRPPKPNKYPSPDLALADPFRTYRVKSRNQQYSADFGGGITFVNGLALVQALNEADDDEAVADRRRALLEIQNAHPVTKGVTGPDGTVVERTEPAFTVEVVS